MRLSVWAPWAVDDRGPPGIRAAKTDPMSPGATGSARWAGRGRSLARSADGARWYPFQGNEPVPVTHVIRIVGDGMDILRRGLRAPRRGHWDEPGKLILPRAKALFLRRNRLAPRWPFGMAFAIAWVSHWRFRPSAVNGASRAFCLAPFCPAVPTPGPQEAREPGLGRRRTLALP